MSEQPADRDPERLAEDLEREADRLERHSQEIGEHIDEAREEWARKQGDDSFPGAQPPLDEDTDFQDSGNPARGPGGPAG